jgi:hypothetical protein
MRIIRAWFGGVETGLSGKRLIGSHHEFDAPISGRSIRSQSGLDGGGKTFPAA